MHKITYITGGARSGKSNFAEKMIHKSKKNKIYLATAQIFDEEMQERVVLHKKQRGEDWLTIEAHQNIPLFLEKYKEQHDIILLDCLTNLVSNRMFDLCKDWENISPQQVHEIEHIIQEEIIILIDFMKKSNLEIIIVSNELGMGLVPAYPLGRHFRDICGRINQYIANEAQKAYFIVSGLSIQLK